MLEQMKTVKHLFHFALAIACNYLLLWFWDWGATVHLRVFPWAHSAVILLYGDDPVHAAGV
jgi:hypothetical protein